MVYLSKLNCNEGLRVSLQCWVCILTFCINTLIDYKCGGLAGASVKVPLWVPNYKWNSRVLNIYELTIMWMACSYTEWIQSNLLNKKLWELLNIYYSPFL